MTLSTPTLDIHLISVAEFQKILAAGALSPEHRYELIEGVIHKMSPIGADHAYTVSILSEILRETLEKALYLVSTQNPIVLDRSQPQPDIVVIARQYASRTTLPAPTECELVVEVADTSVAYDREIKAFLYAAVDIPEYWLVNLPRGVIQQYQAPTAEGYTIERIWQRGDTLTSDRFPTLAIAVTDIVGEG